MHTDLYRLVYLSAATEEFAEEDLNEILRTSRRNNQRRGITGMLLYSDGGFIQALEGPRDEVLDLYETIKQDPRHGSTIKLIDGPTEERDFSEWEMGFKQVDAKTANLKGFSHFLKDPSPTTASRKELARPLKLLLSFKESNERASV